MDLEKAIDIISGWAGATQQEYCVGEAESRALYAELDEVIAFIRDLHAKAQDAQSASRSVKE